LLRGRTEAAVLMSFGSAGGAAKRKRKRVATPEGF
jgi:hypothetical protein